MESYAQSSYTPGDDGTTNQQHPFGSQEQPRIRKQSSSSSENLLSLIEDGFVSSPASESLLRVPPQELSTCGNCSRFLLGLASYLYRNRFIIGVIAAWYLLGVVAIVSTKLLLTEWHVPPLFLTFQQLLLASSLLRLRLAACSLGGAQPLPVLRFGRMRSISSDNDKLSLEDERSVVDDRENSDGATPFLVPELKTAEDDDNTAPLDFYLAGLFNCMDFLASNTAFSASAASFVETIKASDPITTTTVALVYKVDGLGLLEACSLGLLVSGILLSTWGNGGSDERGYHRALQGEGAAPDAISWEASIRSALLVVVANFSFAFRAMTQKLYQRHAKISLNDDNLLFRLQQVGWMTLLIPVIVVYFGSLQDVPAILEHKADYVKLSLVNAAAYATYNWASTYVLSKLSVVQHSTLGCLRRLFVIIMTCLFFGVPLTVLGCAGIVMSFLGFVSFTHFRRRRRLDDAKYFNVE